MDLIKSLHRHKDAYDPLTALMSDLGLSQHEVAERIWVSLEETGALLGHLRGLWGAIGETTPTPTQLIQFLHLVAKNYPSTAERPTPYPDDTPDRGYGEAHLPGWPRCFETLLSKALEHPDGATQLKAAWPNLPFPYREGLACRLACHDIIDVNELPEGTLELAASFAVRSANSFHHRFVQQYPDSVPCHPWPEALWSDAIRKQIQSPTITAVPPQPALTIAAYNAKPEELVAILSKCQWDHRSLSLLEETCTSAALIPLLEDALLNPVLVLDAPEFHQNPWPGFHLIFGLLCAYRAAGQQPSAQATSRIGEALEAYAAFSLQGATQDWPQVHAVLGALDDGLLERLMLRSPTIWWRALPAVKSAAVARRAARVWTEGDMIPYGGDFFARQYLATCGVLAIEPIAEVWLDIDYHREQAVKTLGEIGVTEGVSMLIEALGDRRKTVRKAAIASLLRCPWKTVEAALEEPLFARRKHTREAAARVLAALPPTTHRHALATACLSKGKAGASVETILQSIGPPKKLTSPQFDALDEDTRTAIIDALESSKGAAWRDYQHLGEALLDLYWHFLARNCGDFHIYWSLTIEDYPSSRLLDVISASPNPSHALESAVQHLGAFRSDQGEEFLDRLATKLGQDAVTLCLEENLQNGRLVRPPEFERFKGNIDYLFGPTTAQKWLKLR